MAYQDDRQGHVPCASTSDTNANSKCQSKNTVGKFESVGGVTSLDQPILGGQS